MIRQKSPVPALVPPPAQLVSIDVSRILFFGTVDVPSSIVMGKQRLSVENFHPDGVPESSSRDEDEELVHGKYDWSMEPSKLILKNFIARGTYGTVHRGFYDGKEVAVKLLDWGADEDVRGKCVELRKAFIREVSVWSNLNHRNVTQFVGAIVGGSKGFHIPSHVTEHDGRMMVDGHVSCVVLEYLPGGSLKKHLKDHHQKKLPLKTVKTYALDVANGLAYLHSQRIIHRDIKPDNILLDRQKTLKIADFGVSRVEAQGIQQLAGTYGYMAPEVLLEKPYDHKVDVYSYGILLWEIYTCNDPFPFHQFNPNDVKNFVTQGLRPEIPRCCPADLASIMTRCWEKDAAKRPDMVEVIDLLNNFDPKLGSGMVAEYLDKELSNSFNRRKGAKFAEVYSRIKSKLMEHR